MIMKVPEHLRGVEEKASTKSNWMMKRHRRSPLFPLMVQSLVLIWTLSLVSRARAAVGCQQKGRNNNHLGLYNARNGWVGGQPDCYQFSYTYSTGVVLAGEKQYVGKHFSLPVVNRVARSCAVDTTTTPHASLGLRTITDFYDFAIDRCAGACSNDEETTTEAKLPDCQITYKTLASHFRDPVFGFSLGVMEYEIPEKIIIPTTTQGDREEQHALMFQVSDFVNLDCEKEGMAREDMEDCSKGEFKRPDSSEERESDSQGEDGAEERETEGSIVSAFDDEVCSNWRNVNLGLVQAMASWNIHEPDCYQFTYTVAGLLAADQETYRVAFGRAVDSNGEPYKEGALDSTMSTITDMYDFAMETCTASCPESGPYQCDLTYTEVVASTANKDNGGFGAMFPFQIPSRLFIDWSRRAMDDSVAYQITDYKPLDCKAEGMMRESDNTKNPPPQRPLLLPVGEECHNWKEVSLDLSAARASWADGQPECYQFSYSATGGLTSSQGTYRVAYGRAVEGRKIDERNIWPTMDTIEGFYDYVIQNCIASCPESGPYKCVVEYTNLSVPEVTDKDGLVNDAVSVQVPSMISVDHTKALIDDEVQFRISFQQLDCAKEGMERSSGDPMVSSVQAPP